MPPGWQYHPQHSQTYPPHQYYPYPGPYYYPYQPPERGISTGKLVAIIAAVLAVVILVPAVLVGFMVTYLQTLQQNYADTSGSYSLGLRAERMGDGDWLITVTSSTHNTTGVTMRVYNASTGEIVISTKLSAMDAADGTYNDNNDNNKLDAGDTILLRDTAKVNPGMKVQFLKGEAVAGTVGALPA
jgi:hypothetical protein